MRPSDRPEPESPSNAADPIRLLRFPGLAALPGVGHAVSQRSGGVSRPPYASLNLGLHVGDRPEAVIENRRRLAEALGTTLDALCFAEQVHGAEVARVGPDQRGRGARSLADALPGADALISDLPGTWLVILVADCVPILLADPRRGVVGVAHAGWRGSVQGVAARTVAAICAGFGSRPAELHAAIGPSIGPADFEVGPEVAAAFAEAFPEARNAVIQPGDGDRSRVDLWSANRIQLERAGLDPARIELSGRSTASDTGRWFSHRAEAGRSGRFAAAIALDGPARG